jgi:hypothetical protein
VLDEERRRPLRFVRDERPPKLTEIVERDNGAPISWLRGYRQLPQLAETASRVEGGL